MSPLPSIVDVKNKKYKVAFAASDKKKEYRSVLSGVGKEKRDRQRSIEEVNADFIARREDIQAMEYEALKILLRNLR